MTKLALLGYGSMGHEVQRLASDYGCEVASVYDVDRPLTKSTSSDFDVAIDFTEPFAAIDNARNVCAMGKDLVIGTTGWYEQIHVLEHLQHEANNGIIWGSNFSVGVQMFFRLVRAIGILANDVDEYDVVMHEWHHKRKKDSPSGTALTAAGILLEEILRKTELDTETQHSKIEPHHLHVTSTRGGEIVGKHTVIVDGSSDSIELTHTAKDRSGFAKGALMAARWIHRKQGFYDFTHVYQQIISEQK
jgi:4-hydroxy-tetrahydrodipicolinate reductase